MAKKLSKAQLKALEDFAQAGGHGWGEYAYLGRRTAKALEKRGLVELPVRRVGSGRWMPWGYITQAGLDVLNAERRARGLPELTGERTSLGIR